MKSVEKIATLIGLEETAIQNFASARTARAQQLWIALESFQNLLCNDLVPEGTKRHVRPPFSFVSYFCVCVSLLFPSLTRVCFHRH